jgi:hypothetical protein
VMAERLEVWVQKVAVEPSVPLQLAARCQHLMRWTVPRSDYDEGRIGYLKWRRDLAKKHAAAAAQILVDVGFAPETTAAVRAINLKQAPTENKDVQAMEDALCLTFLEHELTDFCAKHDDAKVIDIVQKTWRKISERGHELALSLQLHDRAKALVQQALA